MNRIEITESGNVITDLLSVEKYNGDVSEITLRVIHPDFTNGLHFIHLTQQGISFRCNINSNDDVLIPLAGAGTMQLQYVVIDKLSQEIIFLSKPFQLLIRKAAATKLTIGSSYDLDVMNREFITSAFQMPYFVCGENLDNVVLSGNYNIIKDVTSIPQNLTYPFRLVVYRKDKLIYQVIFGVSVYIRVGKIQSDNSISWNIWEEMVYPEV